jgi:hypothetical protein
MDDRDDSGRIELDNEAIRADMNATLNELGRKPSPGQLVDRSSSYLRDHGGELAANLGRQIKENPVPFAVTVIGCGWPIAASGRMRCSS